MHSESWTFTPKWVSTPFASDSKNGSNDCRRNDRNSWDGTETGRLQVVLVQEDPKGRPPSIPLRRRKAPFPSQKIMPMFHFESSRGYAAGASERGSTSISVSLRRNL